MLNVCPTSSGSLLPATRYGSSCPSSPIPCPSRWMKCSPWPPASMIRRATPSTSSAGMPARAADVEHDGLAGLDDPVRGLVVRGGGVRPGPDDREVRLVVPLRQEPLANLPGHVGLGPAHEATSGDLRHD